MTKIQMTKTFRIWNIRVLNFFLFGIFVFSLTGTSQAYTLSDGEIRFAQGEFIESDQGSDRVNRDQANNETVKPKNRWLAGLLAFQTLYVAALAAAPAASRREEVSNPAWAVLISSFVLGPTPAHLYTRSHWKTTLGYFLARNGLLVISFGWIATPATAGLGGYESDDPTNIPDIAGALFAGGVVGYLFIYGYEIKSLWKSVREYNERVSKRSSFYLQPLAVPGEYRLNVGYRF